MTTAYKRFHIRQLNGAGGAEVTGVNLANDVDDETIAEIRAALRDYLVLSFPEQPLDDAALARFSARLGPFSVEPFFEGEATLPNVFAVVKEADETKRANFGGSWHSDLSFLPTPASYTLLHARELPPCGGDTLFANQYLAFEALSSGMRRLISGLRAWHSARRTLGPQSVLADPNYLRSMKIKTGEFAFNEHLQPVVRRHPESRRGALYVNKVYTIRIEDMTEVESASLLGFLYEHSVRPEFVIRVAWKPQALTIWDNRAVQHMAVNDYDGFRREMHRTTVQGEQPEPFLE